MHFPHSTEPKIGVGLRLLPRKNRYSDGGKTTEVEINVPIIVIGTKVGNFYPSRCDPSNLP